MTSIPILILQTIWFIAPAYFANSSPTIIGKLTGGNTPLDFGKHWRDHERILGDSKSLLGFFGGAAAGSLMGLFQFSLPTFFLFEGSFGADQTAPLRGLLMGLGALIGDALGSFIKRRQKLKPGESYLGLDQLGFLIAALFLTAIFFPWTLQPVFSWEEFVIFSMILLPLTFIAHVFFNQVAFATGIQNEQL